MLASLRLLMRPTGDLGLGEVETTKGSCGVTMFPVFAYDANKNEEHTREIRGLKPRKQI